MHSVCPPNFAETIVVKFSWEVCIFLGAFNNNSLYKIWRANRVHYGQLEIREWLRTKTRFDTKAKGNPEVANLTTMPDSNFDLGLTSRAD